MKIDLDIPHTFVEGRKTKPRVANKKLEKFSRNGNNFFNYLLAALLVLPIANSIGRNVIHHVKALEQQQEQAEANRQAMISNAIYLKQQIDCARVIVKDEAGNQSFEGMAAVAWTLRNRAAMHRKSICDEATRIHGVHAATMFDYSALNVLFDATRKALAVRENTKAKNRTERAAMKKAEDASAAVITGHYPDITHGATYYISEPAGAKDPRFKGFEDFKANFIRRNRLDASPTAVIGAHWFFRKSRGSERIASARNVPIPLANPYRVARDESTYMAQTIGSPLELVYATANAAFGTSFGANRTQVAENGQ